MQAQTTQIRVTLPIQLQSYLQSKAGRFGLSLSTYVKNLIIDDVKRVENLPYKLSEQSLIDYKAAKQAETEGELVDASDIDKFLDDL